MSSFAHPKSRQPRRLWVVVGASLLVPIVATAALAQSVITPVAELAPRVEREKLAPAVMQAETKQAETLQAEALQAEQRANQLAWDESVKRLRETEQNDPADALAQYKRFFGERAMSPALGVQVGLKIAQMRLNIGDAKGALQTCEVIAAKYEGEPTVVLLTLQKARVLMRQQQLASASEEVNAAMPELVALGPSRYAEISDLLLKLVQANLDSGDSDEKERARSLCVGVEEIYLQWTKKDAVDHLWQRFEALQANYEKAGANKRAEELLPKVGDALLKVPVERGYVEGSVLTLEAARYFADQRNSERSSLLYKRVPDFGDELHASLAYYDQASLLSREGKHKEALQLLNSAFEGQNVGKNRISLLTLQAISLYSTGEFNAANISAQKVISQASISKPYSWQGVDTAINVAEGISNWSAQFADNPILVEPKKVLVIQKGSRENEKDLTRVISIRSAQDVPLIATVNDMRFNVYVDDKKKKTDYFVEQNVVVEIPSFLNKVDAMLTVSSPKLPDCQVEIPLHIEVPKLIQVSSSKIFFGETNLDKDVTKEVLLSADLPFRVLNVQVDTPKLEVQYPSMSAKEHRLNLTFKPLREGGFYKGTLRVQTDLDNEEVTEIIWVIYVSSKT